MKRCVFQRTERLHTDSILKRRLMHIYIAKRVVNHFAMYIHLIDQCISIMSPVCMSIWVATIWYFKKKNKKKKQDFVELPEEVHCYMIHEYFTTTPPAPLCLNRKCFWAIHQTQGTTMFITLPLWLEGVSRGSHKTFADVVTRHLEMWYYQCRH